MENLARSYREDLRAVLPQAPLRPGDLESLAHDLRIGVDAAGVAIVKQDPDDPETLVCIVSAGRCAPPVGARLNPKFGISGRCVREGRPQRSYDTRTDPRVDRSVSERLGVRSLAVVPVLVGSRCIGLIEAVSDRPGHFDQDKLLAIEQAAGSAAFLLGAHPPVSEPPMPVTCTMSQHKSASPEKEEQPEISPPGKDPEPQGLWTVEDEYVVFSGPASVPTLLQERQSKSEKSWLHWTLIVVAAALVATVAGIRIAQVKFPRHLLAGSHTAARQSAFPASQVGKSVYSDQGATRVPQMAPATTNDERSASQLLAQRAAHGDVAAQMDLAQSYLKGDKVPEDSAKAASWYIIAGENGNVDAKRRSIAITHGMAPFEIAEVRFNVGKMYVNGFGIHQDYVSAYTWFELAKTAGDIRAESEENALEKKMSPSQIQDARERASQWLRSHSGKAPHSPSRP